MFFFCSSTSFFFSYFQIVSMNGICKHSGTRTLSLSPDGAITLQLDASNNIHSSCRVELVAPETHSISLLFVRRKTSREKKTDVVKNDDKGRAKCPLIVSFVSTNNNKKKIFLLSPKCNNNNNNNFIEKSNTKSMFL